MSALEADVTVNVGQGAFTVTASLRLDTGVLVLFGPTGAGKSLTLGALAGTVRPAEGRIRVGDRVLFDSAAKVDVAPHLRRIGYVPQHDSLFPFTDVWHNVAFGLPRAERRRGNPRVQALLEELGIAGLASARPASLSGGERQKVALARALVVEPDLLLLDEPFAAIDRTGRRALRQTLRQTLARHDTPAVFVTHSPREARQVGDRLTLFERGRTVRTGDPGELLEGLDDD